MLKAFHTTSSRGANIKGSERGNLLFGLSVGLKLFTKNKKETLIHWVFFFKYYLGNSSI